MSLFKLEWSDARRIADMAGTPVFIYDEATLIQQAEAALRFNAPFGMTVRYAVKAAPNRALLRIFHRKGLHFDASSGFEAHRIHRAGIPYEQISLSAQELPHDFEDLIRAGMAFNACSLNQLRRYAAAFPGTSVGLRFNPGLGSGGNNRTNVGGVASSFGIWHELLSETKTILQAAGLKAVRIHSHIGSGGDPEIWKRCATLTLNLVRQFDSVTTMNLGGGYKVARMPGEPEADIGEIGAAVAGLLETFASETGRHLHLEIEPGTFLVANAACLLSRVTDVVHTGPEGYQFIKADTGMTDILRPSLYGAQHPISLIQENPASREFDVMVVGHCCESGDILTPAPGDPEGLQTRRLPEAAVGDFLLIGGAGAYCSAMNAKNYNTFPESPEVIIRTTGEPALIRRRQTIDQILANEVSIDD